MMTQGRSQSRKRAASLVEVMVVLVVILIGVFSIIRVFPLGLGYLGSASRRTIAVRLAQGMMEQIKADAENLPDAITYTYSEAGNSVTVVSEDPDDLSVRSDGNPYFSDVNKTRFIQGEAIKIGLPTPGNFASGYLHNVKFGPIYLDPAFGIPETAPTGVNPFLAVYSGPLDARNSLADSQNGQRSPLAYRGSLRSARSYVLDPGTDGGGAYLLVLPSAVERMFRAEYLVLTDDGTDDSGLTVRTETEQVQVPANTFAWVRLQGLANDESISPGSDVITRTFRRLPGATPWSTDDPYEYKVASANIAGAPGATSYANLGQLAFNPSGANFTEDVTTGPRAFVAYVDYAVLDWHIIRDDRDVPSALPDIAGAVPVRLTVAKLKRIGDTNPDNTFYDGLFPPADTDPTANYDIRVLRLDTGAILTQGEHELRATTDSAADYWVRDGKGGTWDAGLIYINTNRIPPGTPVRVLYKADGEWAVAVQKAVATYRAWTLSQLGRPPLSGTDGKVQFGDPTRFGIEGNRLYFARSEVNKSVTVRLELVDANGEHSRTAPLQVTITGTDGDYGTADMKSHLPAGTTDWRVVDAEIKGVSVKVRVIWKDRDVDSAPWQIQDLDSYITRGVVQ